MAKKTQSELLEELNLAGEIDPQEFTKSLPKLDSDSNHITTKEEYDRMAKSIRYTPLNKKGAMSKESFISAQRQGFVSEKARVRLRMADQQPAGIEYIDLCYFDKKKEEYVGLNKIPLFYRKLYSHAYGKPNFVFYCHYKDVDRIVEMLKEDKSVIEKYKNRIDEKKKQIDSVLKESMKAFDTIED